MNLRSLIEVSFTGLYYFLTDKHFRKFLYLLFFYGNKKKRYVEKQLAVNGLKLRVPDALSFVWQYYEIYYKRFYSFKSKNISPRIIDCGANIGLSCLYYLIEHPNAKVTAFEASPYITDFLKSNLASNDAKDKVEVIQKAVWVHNEGINLTEDNSDNSAISDTGTLKVESIRLNDYLEKEAQVDFLKMDIEGAEIAVIKDIVPNLHKIDKCFIEYHSYLNGDQELSVILSILEQHNFRYYIENARNQPSPFQGLKPMGAMDLQINVFAWKGN
jgi:FkbM family methyltransferase